MAQLPAAADNGPSAKSEPQKPVIGDDDMVSGMSGFGNEGPAQDDKEAAEEEVVALQRLRPALEMINNVVQDEIDDTVSIKNLIIGAPDQQPDAHKVMIELRARELHLNFLERFRSRITNAQNTIEELRNGG